MSEIKKCTKCGVEYPATKEFFTTNKGGKNNGKAYLRGVCRKCSNLKCKEHYHTVTKKDPEQMERRRKASAITNATEERKEYYRLYKSDNREKLNEQSRELYKKSPEKIRARQNNWALKNKSKKLETCRSYRVNNVEKVKETNKVYRQTEQGKETGRMASQRRLARVRSLPATFTKEQWEDCKNHFGNTCSYCGEQEEDNAQGFVLEQDHFVALKNGGPYTKENVVPSCKRCNISKLDHFAFNWFHEQPFYSLERENKILDYLNSQGKPIQQLIFAI